jgi:hypothetical protein
MKSIILLLAVVSANVLYYDQENWFYSNGYYGELLITSSTIFNASYYDNNKLVGQCNNTDYCDLYADKVVNLFEPDRQYSVLIESDSTKCSSGDYFTATILFYKNISPLRGFIWFMILSLSAAITACGIMFYLLCDCSRIHIVAIKVIIGTLMIIIGLSLAIVSFLGFLQIY